MRRSTVIRCGRVASQGPRRHRISRTRRPLFERLESRELLSVDAWPMRQGDMWNTGRADFDVPDSRLNDMFFDVFRWQTRTPGSPGDGVLSSTSLTFFDGAGPGGADLVVGGYHWPKGVQGMDRHTGQVFWSGLPDGGETIGVNTPAFSNDGSVIYVTNDATESREHPNGRAVMAFPAATGPSGFWDNGNDPLASSGLKFSPRVAPDGRVFLHAWSGPPVGLSDLGHALRQTWVADSSQTSGFSNPALYEHNGLRVISAGDQGLVQAFGGDSGQLLWSTRTDVPLQADPTVDPANGHVYVAAGVDDVFVVGLDDDGQPLWPTAAMPVYDWVDGVNSRQWALSTGCLSFDGATYYFQTISVEGDGRLYAIHTGNGALKWSFETHSAGWDFVASSPIVTRDGVVIVGNNDGDTYFAIRDAGDHGVLVDSLPVDAAGFARASATLSRDGLLYLPLRTVQVTGAGGGQQPTYQVENLFTALDLSAGATMPLFPPTHQQATALNHAVALSWQALPIPADDFDHYAVYRSTAPFSAVAGLTPIATVDSLGTTAYVDTTAENGIGYYYAVTAVSPGGGEVQEVASIGRRTPRDETDLQVLSIARSPEFPRYWPAYQWLEVTEPGSNFGPYGFTSSNGLLGGQTLADQRFPEAGDPVTYTATIRNRGTNPVSGMLSGRWTVDGAIVASPTQAADLAPDATAQFTYVLPWDGQSHDLAFTLTTADARAANNTRVSDPLAVPFATYVDRSFAESFREEWTPAWPQAASDDIFDWLNAHMARFNELFAAAGVQKRVHYGILELIDDQAPEPVLDPVTGPYAVFPLRYHAGVDGDPRLPGYYDAAEDIDYGLLHEMAHQLGLIDIYQLGVPAEANEVSGRAYSPPACLMTGVSHFLSAHSALAMEHWLNDAHGYFGQYLYDIPQTLKLRLLDYQGNPLAGAQVTMYQYAERPGRGKVITNQPKAAGTTDAAGCFTLPNVDIDDGLVPPVGTGDVLHDNPFGYVAVVGTNGVLHFKVEKDGATDFAWLDITETNVAYWQGQTAEAVFDRQLALGMPLQEQSPQDMAEPAAGAWGTWADGATAAAAYDTQRTLLGDAALHFTTDGGFDTYVRYPQDYNAQWNVSNLPYLRLSVYAENANGFQSASPWIRLIDADGEFYQYQYYADGVPIDLMNQAIGHWQTYTIPIDAPEPVAGGAGWRRTLQGTPDLSRVHFVEFHADTWDYGFQFWLDGVGFGDQPLAEDDAYRASAGTRLDVPAPGVLQNDLARNDRTRQAEPLSLPAHGSLQFHADGSFTYVPRDRFVGQDWFTYRFSDGQSASDVATVTLSVTVPPYGEFRLFTDPTLTTPGLVGSYVDRSLRDVSAQGDWRLSQTIAGTRVDPQLDLTALSWGTRAEVGLTHGSDANWEDFSVQWDGYVEIRDHALALRTRSDDSSRMWIDIDGDGAFDSFGPEFVDNHWGTPQAATEGPSSLLLAPGVYRIRVQYQEDGGGNILQLLAGSAPVVRVAYVIPSNRTPQADGVQNLQQSVQLFQEWYRDQLERNGFGAQTVRVETAADEVTPAVYVVSVAETDAWLRDDPWGRVIAAATEAGIPVGAAGQLWLLIPEMHRQQPDGSIEGQIAFGAGDGSWAAPGVAVVSAAGLAYTAADDLSDNTAYHGQILAGIGPYPLVQDVSFPWQEGTTISSLSSAWLGSALLALSHGFGLMGDGRNNSDVAGNLQGGGFRGFRGAVHPALYPNDDTYLGYGQALALSVSPYFHAETFAAELQPPTVTVPTAGDVAPVDGLLPISFTASDDTGLAGALLLVNWSQVAEMNLSGRAVTATFATPRYGAGITDGFQVVVYDVYGNRRLVETEVTPSTGANLAPQPHIRVLGNTTLRLNQPVTLDAAGSGDPDSPTLTVEWDLDGDGHFDTVPTEFRTLVTSYSTTGTHLVRACVTDDAGAQSVSAPVPIRVINPWQNPADPLDVTGEGELTPLDPLTLINHLNSHPGNPFLPDYWESQPPYLDVDGNTYCTALDVLIVINGINQQVAGLAEAEGTDQPSSVALLVAPVAIPWSVGGPLSISRPALDRGTAGGAVAGADRTDAQFLGASAAADADGVTGCHVDGRDGRSQRLEDARYRNGLDACFARWDGQGLGGELFEEMAG